MVKGKVFIINTKNNIGKIIFDDGSESLIMKFPDTYESGDNIEIEYLHNNPSKQILRMHVKNDEWNYGFVMQKFDNGNGIILCTYPKIRGLILYNKIPNNIGYGSNPKVKFKIAKSQTGKIKAVEIVNANKSEFYKCNSPIFGLMKKTKIKPQEGYVDRIIKYKNDYLETGIVTFVKKTNNDYFFGFIKTDNGKNVYFNGNIFLKKYDSIPKINEKVYFKIIKGSKGYSVKAFYDLPEKILLSEKEQYGFIKSLDGRQIRFKISDYKKAYGIEPQKGDIIKFININRKISFIIEERVPKDTYTLIYNKDKKIEKLFCEDKSFKNFVKIEPNQIYFAYSDDNKNAKEVFKFDSSSLSQAISCYKFAKIALKYKIDAIDILINADYKDKNINKNKLLEKKIFIMDNLIQEFINSSQYAQALKYETILQKISYNPKRLSKYKNMLPEYKIIFFEKNKLSNLVLNEKINLIFNANKVIEEIPENTKYSLILKKQIMDDANLKSEKWLINFKQKLKINPTIEESYININLDEELL